MPSPSPVNLAALDLPANAGARRKFEPRYERSAVPPLAVPDQVEHWRLKLGTHPDLVARLWDELPAGLGIDCRVIVYGTPALMHPTTGVVFGFAFGAHAYAPRLPAPEHAAALLAGATRTAGLSGGKPGMDLADVGPEWVLCRWLKVEEAWRLAAYQAAGAT